MSGYCDYCDYCDYCGNTVCVCAHSPLIVKDCKAEEKKALRLQIAAQILAGWAACSAIRTGFRDNIPDALLAADMLIKANEAME